MGRKQIEFIGEVTKVKPEESPDFVAFELPNRGTSYSQTEFATLRQGELDQICLRGIETSLRNSGGMIFPRCRFNLGGDNEVCAGKSSEPYMIVDHVFYTSGNSNYREIKPRAAIDAFVYCYGEMDLLQFRKWGAEHDVWNLAGRIPRLVYNEIARSRQIGWDELDINCDYLGDPFLCPDQSVTKN